MIQRLSVWQRVALVLLFTFRAAVAPAAQEGTIQETDALNHQVVSLYKEGKYKEAIPLAQRALAMREQAIGAGASKNGPVS